MDNWYNPKSPEVSVPLSKGIFDSVRLYTSLG